MNFEQAAILILLVSMLVVFALDRIRMEVVALGGLGFGLALGLVTPTQAFSGFSNAAFITVVEILLIVHVLGRSGVLDSLSRRIPEIARTQRRVLAVLCLLTATLSVFMNNIGALALMLPVVTSVCRVTALDSRRILMPVSFAALLGGLCSVIGTPANLIVSNQLAAATGTGFAFFDFAWVGVPAALAGLLVLVVWPRRVLGNGSSAETGRPPPHSFRTVVTEVEIGALSPLNGKPVSEAGATIHSMRRGGANVMFQRPGTIAEAGDVLLIEIGLPELEAGLASGSLALPGTGQNASAQRVEAVIMPESMLVGSRIGALEGLTSRGIAIVAVATHTPRIEGSLADVQLSIGDVLYLSGDQDAIAEAVEEADILPLWPTPQPEAGDSQWAPVLAFAGGVVLAAFGFAPPELAFGLVVLVLAATGSLDLRRGLAALDWPILIMLAAMLPLGLAVETTGAASVLAGGLMTLLPEHDALVLSSALLVIAVAITPFVNNASTAVILGPIALGVAAAAGIPPEPLLIAVALGASIDFLTPIGHHNNTIVMGLAGYRFVDFIKVGWPVTIAVTGAATLALRVWWA
ncbi:SLC13 family permease [Aurantimonas sp. HBX-1]|uniref:SLC13 family permease n=1 Tax=Aurantimonas sp. HBX-1 TaxID=2906072 RepID=UPI001F398BE5|nr:SLC13 family permease [Aurantimonas sp. HBX-1]UIJ70420.1 SLC13 family permease [Aurantimonas sp. HBX-1]